MHYTSTLETLESLLISNTCVAHTTSELWQSSTPMLRLIVLGFAHSSEQDALFSLSQLLKLPYRLITQVVQRPLKVSQML